MSWKDRQNNEGYKNWLRVGVGLLAARDGLTGVTLRAAKELHAAIKTKLGDSVENCTCSSKKRQECKDCKPWRQELESYYKGGKSQIHWTNCVPNKWSKEPWEVAKVFMPKGQTAHNKGPGTSDSSALLNFLIHCKLHNKYVSAKAAQKVIEVRNRAMHSTDLTLNQQTFNDDMATLLRLMTEAPLDSDPAAQKAAEQMKKIQKEEFHIGADKACDDVEIRVLTDLMDDYKKRLDLQDEELGDHGTRLDVLEQNMTPEATKAVSSILDMINDNDDLQHLLRDQTTELFTRLQQYQNRLGKIEGDVIDIKDDVTQLEETMAKESARLDDVDARVHEGISDVKDEISDVRTSVDDVKEDFTKVKEKLEKLEVPSGSPKVTAGASISYKNTLQEHLAHQKLPIPKYVKVEGVESSPGQPSFTYRVVLQYKNAVFRPDGGFASKKVAIQKACELTLQRMGQTHLTKDPTHCRKELQEFLKKQGQDDPKIDVTQDEQGFLAEVRLTGRAEFPPGDTSTRLKDAEQSAAKNALHALGVPLPAIAKHQVPVRPQKTSVDPATKGSNKDDFKTTAVGSRTTVDKDYINYKTTLKEHVQRQKLPSPSYKTSTKKGPFTSTVTFQTKGAYQTTESAKSKKEAEQTAAKAVISMLNAPFRDTNYKGALQEHACKMDPLDKPSYHTYSVRDGYMSVVRCKAITEACRFEVVAPETPQHVPDHPQTGTTLASVEEAEQNVAKFALAILGLPNEGEKETTAGSLPDSDRQRDSSTKKDVQAPSVVTTATGTVETISASTVGTDRTNVGTVATESDRLALGDARSLGMASNNFAMCKALLQQHVQNQNLPPPKYRNFCTEGGTLQSTICFQSKGAYQTTEPAKSKKEAEQNAANAVILMLKVPFKGTNYKGALQEYASKLDPSNIPTYHTYKCTGGYGSVVRFDAITEASSFEVVPPEVPENVQDQMRMDVASNEGDANTAAEERAANYALKLLGVSREDPTQPPFSNAHPVPEPKQPGNEGVTDQIAKGSDSEMEGTISTSTAGEAITTERTTGRNITTPQKNIESLAADGKDNTNYKTLLQSHVQTQNLPVPLYEDSSVEEGVFMPTVIFQTAGAYQTTEPAKSKKEAEQNAAKAVIEMLNVPTKDDNYKGTLQQYVSRKNPSDIPTYCTYSVKEGYISVVRSLVIVEPCAFKVVALDSDHGTTQAEMMTSTSFSQEGSREDAEQNLAKQAMAILGILQKTSPTAKVDNVSDKEDLSAKKEGPKQLEKATTSSTGTRTTTSAVGKNSVTIVETDDVTETDGSLQEKNTKGAAAADKADINYKDTLQKHVQKQRLPPPTYQDSLTDEGSFFSTVSFKTAGAYQTVQPANSKKESEQNAAKSALEKLKIPCNDSNYKGVLQQHATRADRDDIPKYETYACEGGYATVVSCRAITEVTTFKVTSESEACTSKREAQQRAARKAVELLGIPLQ